jgi:hypothetical protein
MFLKLYINIILINTYLFLVGSSLYVILVRNECVTSLAQI